jgi:chaperonin GroEL (HSP60 family)
LGEENDDVLRQIAMTAMTGKCAESSKESFADILVTAVKQIEENGNIDLSNIKMEKIKKDGMEETELISGIVLAKEKTSKDMPTKVSDAKIRFV